MKKQIISLLLIAVMAAMFLPTVAFADYYGTQWVYTDNGKSLNVRSTPSTGNNIIGSLKYGAEVTVVEMYSNGWAQILWQQNAYGEFGVAYVQRRFLVNHKPTSQPAQPTQSSTAPASGGTAVSTDLAKAFSSALFFSAMEQHAMQSSTAASRTGISFFTRTHLLSTLFT